MLTSVHLLTGAAIGKLTGNVYLTIPAAFLFHYILDAIPHYNQKPVLDFKEQGLMGANKIDLAVKALEPALGLALTVYLIFGKNHVAFTAMALGAFFCWLPDLLVYLRWKHGIRLPSPIVKFETTLHRHTGFKKGILSQIIVGGIAIYFLVI